MHKSRLGGLIIDCKTEDLDSAGEFWSKALGCEVIPSTEPQDKNYRLLNTPDNDVDIEVQQVEHESRVHIDIETDNIEAEALRLEKLGARRISTSGDLDGDAGANRTTILPGQTAAQQV